MTCQHQSLNDRLAEQEDRSAAPLTWEWRILAVAVAWSIPGILAGTLIAVLLAAMRVSINAIDLSAATGLLAALAGGLLEADHWV